MPYTLVKPDGTRLAGYSDENGKTFQVHTNDPAEVNLMTPARKQEPDQPLIRAGESAPRKMTLDLKDANPEG
ncbi:hypothetical protein PMM47T1_28573 [Pseudomonas sp. M47T1]|nr:hypothetical protein PMM47T1_28600 [Pseudomonas sp. M47T1]EIK93122.1 hypothetical protein PMM47T1_28573 [Pseudomonas sp. M47T1]